MLWLCRRRRRRRPSVRPSVDRMVSKVVADEYFFILSAMILGTE